MMTVMHAGRGRNLLLKSWFSLSLTGSMYGTTVDSVSVKSKINTAMSPVPRPASPLVYVCSSEWLKAQRLTEVLPPHVLLVACHFDGLSDAGDFGMKDDARK
jgi:hypothetical protein